MVSPSHMIELSKTPLHQEHVRQGAKMVDFAGWHMPVQYTGLREEHNNVRNNVGLFDVSHMGEIRFLGPEALPTLEWLTTNEVSRLSDGQAQYSLLPNNRGGVVDDIIVYCFKKNNDYLVCVNASNKDKDYHWMKEHNKGAVIQDESSDWAQIAVQGPKALPLLEKVLGLHLSAMKPFTFISEKFRGSAMVLATTGYTGEKGCEIFIKPKTAPDLWNTLLDEGSEFGVMPVGLGARDTLRTEMKYSLYGHEIDDETSPYSAGLGWVIKPDKKDFLGRSIFISAKEQGLSKKLVGFKMLEKGIPRPGYLLLDERGEPIGKVTSGTVSPTLDEPIGIGYISLPYSTEGKEFFVGIRQRQIKARICQTPFVRGGLLAT